MVKNLLVGLWNLIGKQTVKFISGVIEKVKTFSLNLGNTILHAIVDPIKAVFEWIYNSLIKPVVDTINKALNWLGLNGGGETPQHTVAPSPITPAEINNPDTFIQNKLGTNFNPGANGNVTNIGNVNVYPQGSTNLEGTINNANADLKKIYNNGAMKQ